MKNKCRLKPPPHLLLTARQTEVLQLLVNGKSTKQIAGRLGINSHTVNVHIFDARRRLRARTRDQAIARAIMAGYVSIVFGPRRFANSE